jgi:asparagine synthase (glutamine-hydrolysing)
MTALAGHIAFSADSPAAPCAAMLDAQAIYGHETRYRSLGQAAFGRRLWPLTPEDAFDEGPLLAASGRLMLCADVRIDNRSELATMLTLPQALNRMSDAAVMLAAYEQWGDSAFNRLQGAFAVMIWDAEQQSLTLARDPLGERPLHYHVGHSFIGVSSMPVGLHALPAIPYAAHTAAMADFLALVPETGSESFFEGVERALPGHVTVINKQGKIRANRYWHPSLEPLNFSDDQDYVVAVRETFDTAVASRLRRVRGALGSHLSAGLDSSGVTTTAARLSKPDELFAFTSVPTGDVGDTPDVINDEGPLAAATAELHPNIKHIRITAGRTSPLGGLDRHFQLYQRPVLNPCNAVWNDAINNAAQARGVKVMLTGQMGNMTISHSGIQQLSQLARRGALPALLQLMFQMRGRGHRWPGLVAGAVGPFVPPAFWLWLTRRFDRAVDLDHYSALRSDAFDAFGIGERAKERGLDLTYRPWADSKAMRLWALRRVDLGVYYKGTLAGWGIDLRDPTADRRLIELTLRIPERQFILNGECRSIARRAFVDRLPPAVVSERRRGLQAADWRLGVANAEQAIGEELEAFERNPQARMLIDIERLKQANADWPNADLKAESSTMLYRYAMLRAVAAGHFLRKVGRTN